MYDIEAEIEKIQELINANDEKSKLIDNQSKQETDLEKRKELDIEFMKITRDTLALHREQSILSQKSNKLLIKKSKFSKNLLKNKIILIAINKEVSLVGLKNIAKNIGLGAVKVAGTVTLGTTGVLSAIVEEIGNGSGSGVIEEIGYAAKSASFNGIRKMWGKEPITYEHETSNSVSAQERAKKYANNPNATEEQKLKSEKVFYQLKIRDIDCKIRTLEAESKTISKIIEKKSNEITNIEDELKITDELQAKLCDLYNEIENLAKKQEGIDNEIKKLEISKTPFEEKIEAIENMLDKIEE